MYQMQDQAKYTPTNNGSDNMMPPVQQYPPPMMQQGFVQKPQVPDVQNITNLSPEPVQTKCPTCNNVYVTQTTTKTGSGTWCWCLILTFTTGLCCIPFCVDSCKDKIHHCPKCQTVLGTYEYKVCK